MSLTARIVGKPNVLKLPGRRERQNDARFLLQFKGVLTQHTGNWLTSQKGKFASLPTNRRMPISFITRTWEISCYRPIL